MSERKHCCRRSDLPRAATVATAAVPACRCARQPGLRPDIIWGLSAIVDALEAIAPEAESCVRPGALVSQWSSGGPSSGQP
jgi:hypothetical protein